MRASLLLPLLPLASGAYGQRPTDPNEGRIWDAYTNLREGNATGEYKLELTGREEVGSSATTLHSVLYWSITADPRTLRSSLSRAELDVYQTTQDGENLILRLVGDGTTLYRYDRVRREVSARRYGFYGETPPPGHTPAADALRLIAMLRAETPAQSAYLVRLIDEINPLGADYAATYTSWLPGLRALDYSEVPVPPKSATGLVVTDPVSGGLFPTGGQYVFYGYDRRGRDRTVAFSLYDAANNPDEPLWEVESVKMAFRQPNRLVAFSIVPSASAAPDWAYRPYIGAEGASYRPVATGN